MLIDFKTKDFDDDAKPLHWDEQVMQLAAYSFGLWGTIHPTLISIYISRTKIGLVRHKVWTMEDKHRGWAMFDACRLLWQAKNNFNTEKLAKEKVSG